MERAEKRVTNKYLKSIPLPRQVNHVLCSTLESVWSFRDKIIPRLRFVYS